MFYAYSCVQYSIVFYSMKYFGMGWWAAILWSWALTVFEEVLEELFLDILMQFSGFIPFKDSLCQLYEWMPIVFAVCDGYVAAAIVWMPNAASFNYRYLLLFSFF